MKIFTMKTLIAAIALNAALLSGAALAEPFNQRGTEPFAAIQASQTQDSAAQARLAGEGYKDRSDISVAALSQAVAEGRRIAMVLRGFNDRSTT